MRVAITGATGNIGTRLVRVLSADDRVSSVLRIARRRPEWTVPKTDWVAADLAEDDLDGLFAGATRSSTSAGCCSPRGIRTSPGA